MECFLFLIREVAFGAGADSMAATWLHSILASASLASMSFQSETDSYPLIDLVFMLEDLSFD